MSTYLEKLKDPRWQRCRLEVMERDDFACRHCGDRESTLNVHHTYYERGLQPWEYDRESLLCLCESCHHKAEDVRQAVVFTLGQLTLGEQDRVLKFARDMLNMHEEFDGMRAIREAREVNANEVKPAEIVRRRMVDAMQEVLPGHVAGKFHPMVPTQAEPITLVLVDGSSALQDLIFAKRRLVERLAPLFGDVDLKFKVDTHFFELTRGGS